MVKNLNHVKHADLFAVYTEFGLGTDAPRKPEIADATRINKLFKDIRNKAA